MKSAFVIVLVALIGVGIYFHLTGGEMSCYIYNSEAGDSLSLKWEVKGDKVNGSFYQSIAGKDLKTGDIGGTLEGNTAHLTWDAGAEGQMSPEELMVKVSDTIVQPAYGEMTQIDGVYRYTHPELLTYPLSLQKTECSDPAVK